MSAPELFNLDAEAGFLGTLLCDNKLVEKVSGIVKAEHFHDPVHREIFEAITRIVGDGGEASPVTLRTFFSGHPKDSEMPDGSVSIYIRKLLEAFVSAANAPYYARQIADLAHRRELAAVARALWDDAHATSVGGTAQDVLGRHESALAQMDDRAMGEHERPLVTLREAVEQAIDTADRARKSGSAVSGVTTGLKDLDWHTGGLQKGDLIVLGGRPSMGKTDLAWNIAVNAARAKLQGRASGAGCLIFSQEMRARQLGARTLARETGIPADRQRRGDITDEEYVLMTQAITDAPVWIDDSSMVKPDYIRRRARSLVKKGLLGMLMVDHLQITGTPDSMKGRNANSTAIISEVTKVLKEIATSFDVPLVLLSQLNRAVEMREEKRPQLADLRESGSIEQDADVVMFVHRDHYYLERSEPSRKADESDEKFNDRYANWRARETAARNLAEVIIAKQRMGSLVTVNLHYDGARSTFSDLEWRP
ncbi:replicative DNA helicase [Azospirillum argentinense]|uniref:replicative DNA helicase n=1 Tax=Azospirillum argentinense TaxID=2970906 RepID=UPI0032DF8E3C